MKKFEGMLLITDFDGTLACHGTISKENCSAIRYFQENGGLFTFSSGRQLGWVKKWSHLVMPNTWVSLVNGALICDPTEREIVFRQYSGRELLELAPRIFEACPQIEFVNHSLEGEVYRQDPGMLLTEDVFSISPDTSSFILLIIVGIVHTGIAYSLYFGSIDKIKIQTAAMFSYIDPVVALILSALLLKEEFTPIHLIGSILILGAAFISEIPSKKELK